MPDYRRYFVPGGTYFFTLVVHQRRPILTRAIARAVLREAIERERGRRPFEIVAWVLLPEHLHAIWTLPPGDAAYPLRWSKIKEHFTRGFLAEGGKEGSRPSSRLRRRERAVWQQRYWEHTCMEETDLKAHLDYVHWNPVKHELVTRAIDYPWSSFHRYLTRGEYEADWGGTNPCPALQIPEAFW